MTSKEVEANFEVPIFIGGFIGPGKISTIKISKKDPSSQRCEPSEVSPISKGGALLVKDRV